MLFSRDYFSCVKKFWKCVFTLYLIFNIIVLFCFSLSGVIFHFAMFIFMWISRFRALFWQFALIYLFLQNVGYCHQFCACMFLTCGFGFFDSVVFCFLNSSAVSGFFFFHRECTDGMLLAVKICLLSFKKKSLLFCFMTSMLYYFCAVCSEYFWIVNNLWRPSFLFPGES